MTAASPTYLEDLNDAQRRAATHGDGPLLIIAGAGTGKTKTLAARVACLLDRGTPAEKILLLTFTRRAASEMLARAARVAPTGSTSRVWGGTFHAMANRLLRQHGRAVGLAPEFTVLDQSDAEDVMNLVRGDLGLAKTNRRFPRKATLLGIYSRMVSSRTKLGPLVEEHYPWCHDDLEGIRQCFEHYTRRKRANNVLDYDDLLLYWRALLNVPNTGNLLATQFDHILVDEYQDTNILQAEILQAMRATNRNLTVVGDDAQSIYSFRAATIRNILDFPEQYPNTTVITLEQNYRSIQPILDASNAVMSRAAHRYTKHLFSKREGVQKPQLVTCADETDQTAQVCTRLLEALERGIILKRQAVLFRSGHHSDQLEVELTRRNIPFVKYGGLKFIESAHIKDMLALLRLLENPADEISWYRVLQLLQSVGPAIAARVMTSMGLASRNAPPAPTTPADGADPSAPQAQGLQSLGVRADALPQMLLRAAGIPAAARDEFAALRKTLLDCLGHRLSADATVSPASDALPPGPTVERIRRFYDPIFKRTYENPQVRLRDLEQLEVIATGYKSRCQFITDLTLDPPTSTQDLAGPPLLEEDWLTLSTIHSAKGCEWDIVHILHTADGMIPSDMSTGNNDQIEEERRLLYVAMTRAKDALHLYFPLRYYRRNRGMSDLHSYAQLTRFIAEDDYPLYERIAPAVIDQPDAQPGPTGTPQKIDDMLTDLWNG